MWTLWKVIIQTYHTVFSKDKDIFLLTHISITKTRNFNPDTILLCNLQFTFSFSNNVLYRILFSVPDPTQDHVLHVVVMAV